MERPTSLIFKVDEKTELLPFLLRVMPKRSRNSVKSILKRGQVTVDDHIETKHNYPLLPNQEVKVLKNKEAIKSDVLVGLKILYEDKDVIVVNKEAGLLTIATEKEKEQTAYFQLMNYVRQQHPDDRIFIVHRLDRDTSGVMMLAKNKKAKQILQKSWKEIVKERTYVALVEGEVKETNGTIQSWLKETKTHHIYSSSRKNDGKLAITHFKKIQSNQSYSLMELQLETGRKNQIRVHMKDIGHPIVGDKKYGSEQNAIGRLGLHAYRLSFYHPITGKFLLFQADVPRSFYAKSSPK